MNGEPLIIVFGNGVFESQEGCGSHDYYIYGLLIKKPESHLYTVTANVFRNPVDPHFSRFSFLLLKCWSAVELTEAGMNSPLEKLTTPVLHWHGEMFDVPDGADHLACMSLCAHQAFAIARHTLALQFHAEVECHNVEQWLLGHINELDQAGVDLSQLRRDTARWATQNEINGQCAYIESFNRSFRDECLNLHWFLSMKEAQEKIEVWRQEYNESRPHRALNNLSPNQYAVLKAA